MSRLGTLAGRIHNVDDCLKLGVEGLCEYESPENWAFLSESSLLVAWDSVEDSVRVN